MKVIYSQEDVETMKGILNGLTVTGIQNCRQIAVLAQILDGGTAVEEKKEGEK